MALDSTKALVNLPDAKLYLGIAPATTTNDRLIDRMILQASVLVRKEVSCDILKTAYTKETHNGTGSAFLYLDNWPVVTVDRASVYTDAVCEATNSGSTNTHATIEVTKTQIRLRSAASGVWTTTEITIADYATLTLITAAVSDKAGWSASANSGWGNWPASELVVQPARNAMDVTISLYVPEACQTDYEIYDPDWGSLYNPYGWGTGKRDVFIDYTAGWSRNDMPEPIQSAVMELVALMYNMKSKDGSIIAEKLGDYSYKLMTNAGAIFDTSATRVASNMIMTKLTPYKRVQAFGV